MFEPHEGEEELDVEYRVLFSEFMKEALETINRLGDQKDTLEVPHIPPTAVRSLSGHALRKRHPK